MGKTFLNREVSARLLKGADFVAYVVAGFWLTATYVSDPTPATPAIIGFSVLCLAFLCVLSARGLGLYEPSHLLRPLATIAKSVAVISVVGAAFAQCAGYFGLFIAPGWVLAWACFVAAWTPASRLLASALLRIATKDGNFKQRIAIVGGGKAAEDAINALEASTGLDIEIVGLFDDRYDSRSPASIRRHTKLGNISELAAYARGAKVDLIIVAIPMSAEQRLLQILKRIWQLPVDIRISGAASQLKLSPQAYAHLGNLALLPVFDRPLNPWSQFLKDMMDKFIAVCAIIALSPIILAAAVAVRFESKGPVIFKQKRYGFNNELIEVYKFRSMHVDQGDATASKLVTKGDPRVTRVGRVIRKTSVDELPQLFNVLKGQLSLVGPRPHATQAKAAGGLYDEVVEGYFARHRVKPGITGWAQVNGWRGETDTIEKISQRVKHDLEYIDKWSLAFDLLILLKTPLSLLKSENAY